MLEKKQSLKELAKGIQMYPQCMKNIRVSDKKMVMQHADVLKKKEELEVRLCGDGRIVLRESGTEPLIRVMVEAQTQELCEQYVDEMIQVIENVIK